MVHGCDKFSPLKKLFVSRCLGCASLLVLVCLWANSQTGESTVSSRMCNLKMLPTAVQSETRSEVAGKSFGEHSDLAHQPGFVKWTESNRPFPLSGQFGEALSWAGSKGQYPLKTTPAEMRPPTARRRGTPTVLDFSLQSGGRIQKWGRCFPGNPKVSTPCFS